MGQARVDDRDYVAIGHKYATDVAAGKIPACKWVKAACQRQIDDRERAKRGEWKWIWDKKRAWDICYFAEQMPHIKGKWKSKNIHLEPWQCFHLTTVFGWVDKEDNRRFRKALIVVPRKNAKTTEAAIIGLYLLAQDGENGAEIYSAATTRDQAKISWDMAKRMAQRSPGFCERFGIDPLAHSIAVESQAAFFKPLSRDADSLEGLNPSGAIIDELHAHKTREVFDVLDEATGARRQPLIFIISTEGDNANGVFAEQVEYAQQILDGRHEDDSYFAIIYTIDADMDWTTREAWAMANPNMGISVLEKDLEIRCRQAQKNAESQSSFLTKRLNVRVGAGEAFFNLLAWNTICKDDTLRIEDFYGKPCIVGLDLASKIDIAAKVLLFDKAVFAKFYLPEDTLERGNPNYDVYRGWAERGLLTLTPGNVIDFEFIERDLLDDKQKFSVTHVAYDPDQAHYLSTRMQAEGFTMVELPQNIRRMNDPMKELGARILSGRIKHDGNQALAWQIGNVTAKPDAKENVFPKKARPENKIDGAVAAMIALSVQLRQGPSLVSIYNGAFAI